MSTYFYIVYVHVFVCINYGKLRRRIEHCAYLTSAQHCQHCIWTSNPGWYCCMCPHTHSHCVPHPNAAYAWARDWERSVCPSCSSSTDASICPCSFRPIRASSRWDKHCNHGNKIHQHKYTTQMQITAKEKVSSVRSDCRKIQQGEGLLQLTISGGNCISQSALTEWSIFLTVCEASTLPL